MHLRMLKKAAYDVSELQTQLAAHPEVWDTLRMRTEHPRSPHREASDIWVRYNPIENYTGDVQAFNSEHVAEWYPVCEVLTEAKRLASQISRDYGAEQLGGVLITKVPAGKQIYPHADVGWHARHYSKFALQIQGNDRQRFKFEGEELITRDGDTFWFENSYPHWVTNDSDEDRITMIVCINSSKWVTMGLITSIAGG